MYLVSYLIINELNNGGINMPLEDLKSVLGTVGGVVGGLATMGAAHAYLSRRRLKQLVQKIERLNETAAGELQESIIFQPLDKLYLIRSLEYPDLALEQHHLIRDQITTAQGNINTFLGESAQFSRFFKLVNYRWYNQQLQGIYRLRDSIRNLLNYAGNLNSAQLYFKQRLYDLAESSVKEALTIADEKNREISLPRLTWQDLCAHTYNLAAKIARCQKKYKDSAVFYDKALHYSPTDIHIIGSQIALWGDFAWNQQGDEKINLDKLRQFLADEKREASFVENCQEQKYGLGLANLSWFYIQAAKNTSKLGCESAARQGFLEKAKTFAEMAVVFEARNTSADKSVNAWLFLGIAKMDLGNNNDRTLLQSAQADFAKALERDSYHPSLLRRKALVLALLGEDARKAYQDLLIELQYRIDLGDKQSNYFVWLEEAKAALKIPDEKESKGTLEDKEGKRITVTSSLTDTVTEINHCLVQKYYQTAYDLLNQLSPKIIATNETINRLNDWFVRHYTISSDKKLTPKLRQHLLIDLAIDNLPTPDIFMRLSIATYYAKHGKTLGLPPDWQAICTSQEFIPAKTSEGYLAVAFQHIPTKQIIIAHGGTDVSDWHDLKADMQLALGEQYAQLPLAEKFTRHVVQTYGADLPSNRCQTIYHTGHSLGGAIAAYMACASGSIKLPQGRTAIQYAVTFDSPSCWWQLDSNTSGQLKTRLLPEHYSDFPITAYVTRPTFINCAGGPQLGRVMKLPVYPDKTRLLQEIISDELCKFLRNKIIEGLASYTNRYGITSPELVENFQKDLDTWWPRIKANVACHNAELISAAFAADLPQIYQQPHYLYYAAAWPRDLEKWLAFERDMARLNKDPLTYIPEYKEEAEPSYTLQPLAFAGGERIPLDTLESELRAFFLSILPRTKMLPILSDKHRLFKTYLVDDFFDWVKLSDDKKSLEITGPLSAWEILGYIRGQIHKACQDKNLSYEAFMSSLLARSFHPVIRVEEVRSEFSSEQGEVRRASSTESTPLLISEKKAESKSPRSAASSYARLYGTAFAGSQMSNTSANTAANSLSLDAPLPAETWLDVSVATASPAMNSGTLQVREETTDSRSARLVH